jgi:hypothetical protein
MQAMKMFTSGGGSSSGGGGGGGMQTQLISMAMSEASSLFDKQGAAGGNKQDAVNSAAMTVMKLLVQSKFGGGAMGGGNSGGMGSLMGMVRPICVDPCTGLMLCVTGDEVHVKNRHAESVLYGLCRLPESYPFEPTVLSVVRCTALRSMPHLRMRRVTQGLIRTCRALWLPRSPTSYSR